MRFSYSEDCPSSGGWVWRGRPVIVKRAFLRPWLVLFLDNNVRDSMEVASSE